MQMKLTNQRSEKEQNYLAEMCHEIGTPLAAITGLSYILANVECSPQRRRECAEMIGNSSKMLTDLMQRILDCSMNKGDLMGIERQCFNLAQMIEEVVDIVSLEIEQKGLKLYVHIGKRLPEKIIGDPLRLRQILLNLLTNAVKFTTAGYISLYVNEHINDDQKPVLSITVADSGIGMSDEEVSKIFTRYAQANENIASTYGGTGLGLALSRDFARMMHGDITAKSWPGVGSRFVVTLPLEAPKIFEHDAEYLQFPNENL